MSNSVKPFLPENLHDAVDAGLRSAFDGAEVDRVETVTGGASGATTLRLQVDQRAFLLRVESVRSPLRNPHQYTCMRIAAAAAIAPSLRYVDDQVGIAIMDFIPAQPLESYPGGPAELARAMAALTARLQSAELFPVLADYRAIVRRLFGRVQARFAPGLLDPHQRALENICESLPWDTASHVCSHNDPNPRNVLFDGRRLWLIDWETAYRNDPLVDVSILVDNLAPTPDLETAFLEAWQGSPPDAALRQRLRAIRSLTRVYYAGLLALIAGPASVTSDLAALTPDEFRRRIANGLLKPATAETCAEMVKMQLAAFMAMQ